MPSRVLKRASFEAYTERGKIICSPVYYINNVYYASVVGTIYRHPRSCKLYSGRWVCFRGEMRSEKFRYVKNAPRPSTCHTPMKSTWKIIELKSYCDTFLCYKKYYIIYAPLYRYIPTLIYALRIVEAFESFFAFKLVKIKIYIVNCIWLTFFHNVSTRDSRV